MCLFAACNESVGKTFRVFADLSIEGKIVLDFKLLKFMLGVIFFFQSLNFDFGAFWNFELVFCPS